MDLKQHLARLLAHLAWANGEVLRGLRTNAGSDPQALEYFAHVLGAEHVWMARISARAPTVAVWPALTLDECEALSAASVAALDAFLGTLDGEGLMREVTYRNSAGREFTSSHLDILTHVAMHGTYHRGQVSLMMRRGGGEPVPTDFIAFTRGAPTATRADAR